MTHVLNDVARTIVPICGDRLGPLPLPLLVLTIATGLVDAVSYLALGRVFVANLTGNVVFPGFAMAAAHYLSVLALMFRRCVLSRASRSAVFSRSIGFLGTSRRRISPKLNASETAASSWANSRMDFLRTV